VLDSSAAVAILSFAESQRRGGMGVPFRVVQPWGPDKGRQSTVQSEHKTVAEAFAALDVVATDMEQSGVPGDAIELVVVDEHGRVVPRPNTN